MRPALTYTLIATLLSAYAPSNAWAEYRCRGQESEDGTVYTVEGSGNSAQSCPVKCTRAYDGSDNTDHVRYVNYCAGHDAGSTRWISASSVYYTSSAADTAVRNEKEDDNTAAYVIGGAAALGIFACLTGVICKKGGSR